MKVIKGLILLIALSTTSCQEVENRVDSIRKVKCEKVITSTEKFESATFTGRVTAATDVNLGFRVAGIIEQICVSDGDYVHKGTVLTRLDSRDYALQKAATQAEYDAIKAEVDRIVALHADQSVSTNDYDKAVNGLKAITAKLEAHKNALADTELRAPIDGYINKSNFSKGEAVAAGTPIISLISASAPEVSINIPAAYYLKQDRFQEATATIELFEDTTFNLILKGISPKANLNQLYKASFILDNSNGLTPAAGMTSMVTIKYKNDSNSYTTIPFKAIIERSGKSYVWIVNNEKVESREIKVGEIKSNGRAIIISGVNDGEIIVTAGVNTLQEEQQVDILQEASKSNIGGIM